MSIFTGAGTAIVTPFKASGEIDFNKFEELIEDQIAGSIDCIVVAGTTGEAATMSDEEQLAAIKFTCDVVKGRVPVVAGTGSNNTAHAIHLSVEAEKLGADGLLLVSPYYNKATQNGLKAHFTAIANSVKIPSILYNVPSRTGMNIAPATVVDLCKTVDNIVAVKEASGNFSAIAQIMNMADGCVDVYSGNDDQIVPLLALGGKGVISVLSNVAPKDTHDICAKYLAGDVKGSLELQMKYLDLCKALFCEVNPIPVKKAVELMGMCNGLVRRPLTEMEEENALKLAAEMKKLGIIA